MRGPIGRRKAPPGNGLGQARLAAVIVALAAGAVTYYSVQALGQVVIRERASTEQSAAVASGIGAGAGWKETWRLARELGEEGLGFRHRPQHPLSPRLIDSAVKGNSWRGGSQSHEQSAAHSASDSSGADATKGAQIGSHLAAGGSSSRGGDAGIAAADPLLGNAGADPLLAMLPPQCNVQPHTDYAFGEPVRWGTSNFVDNAGECCRQCREYKPKSEDDMTCNVWVWCGNRAGCEGHYRECWLKHLPHPDAAVPNTGPKVPWTAGVVGVQAAEEETVHVDPNEDRSFHTVITAEGTATHWQARICYYHFLKVKKACQAQGNCQMGGFTRVLHGGKADELMDEIPSVVVDPLPPEKHNHGNYVVINRPYAFTQWTSKAKIKEKYILMSEPDHIWLRPMPNLMKGSRPAAFPFFYIEPSKKEFRHITEKFTGPLTNKEAEQIAPIGNAPTMMAWDDLQKVAPLWANLSLSIFLDPEANKEWGWVQEMYAFTLAAYNAGVPRIDLHKKMMAQPPWDTELTEYYVLHYTYGQDFTLDGVFTPGKVGAWHFDKRAYASMPPPRNLPRPPDGMKNDLVRKLIDALNEAMDVIPGWDDFAKTGVATQLWDGKTFGTSNIQAPEMTATV